MHNGILFSSRSPWKGKFMVRISDIAKAMQLSEATVSNALSGKGRMQPQTREQVRQKALEMGYHTRRRHPKPACANPIIIIEDFGTNFVDDMLSGALTQAAADDLFPAIYSLGVGRGEEMRAPDIRMLNSRISLLLSRIEDKVSGILYLSQYARQVDGLMADLPIPHVTVFATRQDGHPYVHYDDHQGAWLAVNSLLKLGRKRIAMVSGPIDSMGMYLRSSGYQQALVEHNLPYDPRLVRIGDWDAKSGYLLTEKLLQDEPGIDAVFAQNDAIGFGAMQAIKKSGLRVPTDVAVIGFDNTVFCPMCNPPLSSVVPPFEAMGKIAFYRLLEQMTAQNAPGTAKHMPSVPVTRPNSTSQTPFSDQKGNPLIACTLALRDSTGHTAE